MSIIIVSFNTRDMLHDCLQSVYLDGSLLSHQVIVVDNASTDGSAEMVERDFPQAVLVRCTINLGFGQANNLGFEKAKGRYIVLLNSDAFLYGESLDLSIAHMDANPQVALGGGRLLGRDESSQPSARMFPSLIGDLFVLSGLAARFPKSRIFGHSDRTWANEMEAAEVDWVPGAYSIVRPAALAAVGGFDPRFFLYYEEVDLCRRMKQHGYSIWYWPDVTVTHIGGESSRQLHGMQLSQVGTQLTLWRMRSMLLYYRKYHGMKVWFAMLTELLWYWLRSNKRRLSPNPRERAIADADRSLVTIMRRAWRDTKGGRLSPAQPW